MAALARRIASESKASDHDSGELAAFGAKADELEQAVQQQKEREEVIEETKKLGGHVKDEL